MNLKSFFKLYTMPILALFVGFGLYYGVFVATNKDISVSNAIYPNQDNKKDSIYDPSSMLDTSTNNPTQSQSQEASSQPSLIPEESTQTVSASKDLTQNEVKSPNIYVVIPKTVNIRDKPNISSVINGKLSQGQKVEIKSINGNWGRIQQGWVLLSLLKKEQSGISNLNDANNGFYIVIPKIINIRLEPNTFSKIINRLPVNSVVEVQYIKDGWAKLKNGWVLASLLKRQDDD